MKNLIKIKKYLAYKFGRLLVKIFGLKKFSYSSLNEDNIIDWLTGYKKSGFYIDIGANNPDLINNTRLFYERGWRGINIEPSEKEFKMLQEKRPKDKNYNCAIGQSGKTVFFYEGEKDNSGNTFNKEIAEKRKLRKKRSMVLKSL